MDFYFFTVQSFTEYMRVFCLFIALLKPQVFYYVLERESVKARTSVSFFCFTWENSCPEDCKEISCEGNKLNGHTDSNEKHISSFFCVTTKEMSVNDTSGFTVNNINITKVLFPKVK